MCSNVKGMSTLLHVNIRDRRRGIFQLLEVSCWLYVATSESKYEPSASE